MRISPVSPMSVSSASTSPFAPVTAPPAGLAAPVGPTGKDEARQVFRDYNKALMRMPGVVSVGWQINEPDAIHMTVQTDELRFLLQQAIAPSINGVPVIFRSPGTVEPPADSWVRIPTNVARAISGLPGINEWYRFNGYTFIVDTKARIDFLRPMLPTEIDGEPVRLVLESQMP